MFLQCLQHPRKTCGRPQKLCGNHSLQAYRWTNSLSVYLLCLFGFSFFCPIFLIFSSPCLPPFIFPSTIYLFPLFCQFLPWSLAWTQFVSYSQVYPRTTILQLQSCDLSIQQITFTPTIPAREHEIFGYPKFYFWLPDEVQLVNQQQCEIEFRGTTPVTLNIKATCPQNTQIATGLRAIVPQISEIHPYWFRAHLPTVWVRIQNIRTIKKETKNFKAVYKRHLAAIVA